MSAAVVSNVCVTAAAVMGLLGETVALADDMASLCDVYEYYDARRRECRHCDSACFEYENGAIVSFMETRCFQLCPGYIKAPRVPQFPIQEQEEAVRMTVMEGGLFGFIIALIIVCAIVVVLLRAEMAAAVKRCSLTGKMLGGFSSSSDVSETSYIKLSDPSDEMEIVDRVTCV